MAVSSNHLNSSIAHARNDQDFAEMTNFSSFHPFPPNHSPSATSGSDHSASVSPPSFVHHDNPRLSGHAHHSLFVDDDDMEDDSFENIAMESKFHATFHPHGHKKDSRSLSQANKLKATTAERRATHNAIERARRESLNGRFLELARALPTMSNVKRPSKSVIVNKSLEWISESQMREYHLIRENNYLRSQVNELRSQLRLGPLPPPSFGNPVHMPPKEVFTYKSSPAYPLNHSIGLPVTSSLLHVGGPMTVPAPLSMNESINMSVSGKLGPPVPLLVDRGFDDANKDTYDLHRHDRAAGPFHSHHQRAQSFPSFAPGFVVPTDDSPSIHGATSSTFSASTPTEPVPLAQDPSTVRDRVEGFQAGFDSQQVMISEDGMPSSPGTNGYYLSSDDDGASSNPRVSHTSDFNLPESGGGTGNKLSPVPADPTLHQPSIDLFGHPIGTDSTEVNGGKVVTRPIPLSGLPPHRSATLPADTHTTSRAQLDDSIIDLLQAQCSNPHLSSPNQPTGWLTEQPNFDFNFVGPPSYIY